MILGGVAERWTIDLTGPHPMLDGYKYIFTAICPFSKYANAVPIRDKEATTVAKSSLITYSSNGDYVLKYCLTAVKNLQTNFLPN